MSANAALIPEAETFVKQLGLSPHPEGGYFRQVYAGDLAPLPDGRVRPQYTSIYFLLVEGQPSHLHRLKSDELWYWHGGAPLTVHLLHPDGRCEAVKLGLNLAAGEVPQLCVPAGVIFGSDVPAGSQPAYSLVSCAVSPGFDFADFELFTQAELLEKYPQHAEMIQHMAYAQLP